MADVVKRISPTIGDLILSDSGDDLLAIGHKVCGFLAAGQYPAATALKGIDQEGSRFWLGLNTLTTTVPAAAQAYCPDQVAGFETWANTPSNPAVGAPGDARYSHPPKSYSSTAVDPGCMSAMEDAAVAAIAKEGANDPELSAAASACPTPAQFGTALIRHPDAAGATSMNEGQAADFLQLVCRNGATSAACVSARADGWFN